MRKIFLLAVITATVSCNNGETPKVDKDTTAKAGDVTYAYPIAYSAKWEMGDPKLAQKVSELWKDFDDNNLDNQKNTFADSVTMDFDGMSSNGPRDSMIASTKGYRNSLGEVHSKIAALMSTKSTDKNEDWVLIWGIEATTSKEGKTDSTNLHEIWRFNKEGKVDYIAQYRRSFPKKK